MAPVMPTSKKIRTITLVVIDLCLTEVSGSQLVSLISDLMKVFQDVHFGFN